MSGSPSFRAVSGEAFRRRPQGWLWTVTGPKPALPPWPHSACPPEGLAGGCAPFDPQLQTSRRERREVGQSMACQWPPRVHP